MPFQMLREALRGLLQGNPGASRQRQQMKRALLGPMSFRGVCTSDRSLFQHRVRIDAANPERTHAGAAHMRTTRPGPRLDRNDEWQFIPRQVRRRIAKMQVGWNFLMLQRQHDLDESRDAGEGLEVSEVGLDRSHYQRAFPAGREYAGQCLQLDRVAQWRPGAMRF